MLCCRAKAAAADANHVFVGARERLRWMESAQAAGSVAEVAVFVGKESGGHDWPIGAFVSRTVEKKVMSGG